MASRTVVDSVDIVAGPPRDVAAIEAQLDALRRRYPGAILERYLDRVPTLGERVRIAAGAAVVGDVTLADEVSVWYGCVLRADVNRIEIRERSNVQDGSVVHLGDASGTFVADPRGFPSRSSGWMLTSSSPFGQAASNAPPTSTSSTFECSLV